MTDTKNWWASKTVWGGLVALCGGLAGLFGLEVDGSLSENLVAALTEAAGAIGAVVAIFGRFDARATLR